MQKTKRIVTRTDFKWHVLRQWTGRETRAANVPVCPDDVCPQFGIVICETHWDPSNRHTSSMVFVPGVCLVYRDVETTLQDEDGGAEEEVIERVFSIRSCVPDGGWRLA